MSLLDEVAAQSMRKGPTCGVVYARTRLPADEAAELVELLADPLANMAALERALRSREIHVAQATLARHRRSECSCSR